MRAIAHDYEKRGDKIWIRFNQKDKREHEWYYRQIAELTRGFADTDRYQEYIELCNTVFMS